MANTISITIEQTRNGFTLSNTGCNSKILIDGGLGRKHLSEAYRLAALYFLELSIDAGTNNGFGRKRPSVQDFGLELVRALDNWYDQVGLTKADLDQYMAAAKAEAAQKKEMAKRLEQVKTALAVLGLSA